MQLNKDVFIGFDGGGTKTICVIGDEFGNIIASATGASTNLKSRPVENVKAVIHDLLAQVLQLGKIQVNQIKGVYVSTAGGDREEDRGRWREWILEFGIKTNHIKIDNDAVGALAAGTFTKNGIVLIAGTGSIAYSVRDDLVKPKRVGGWGFLLGDEGSGYDIGNQALRMIAGAHDSGGHKKKTITGYILEKFGLENPEQLITFIYENHYPRQLIASVAKYVVELAEQEEPNAKEVIQNAVDSLVNLVFILLRNDERSKANSLVISGGLFHSTYFKNVFEHTMGINGFEKEIILPKYPPVVGSYICALLQNGVAISELVEQNINNSWERAL